MPAEAAGSASVAPEVAPGSSAAPGEAPAPTTPPAFALLGAEIPAGSKRQVSWYASQNYSGIDLGTPVLVAHGTRPGPVLCVTAAVHGDEINGVEMARRVFQQVETSELRGILLAVPIVNLHGFERSYRYLADRRDLNRYFPGSPRGSSAARIAHSFFNDVIRHCDALVDLHTGSFHRTNLPQLRADLSNPAVVKLTQGFGATAVLRGRGPRGTLRRAATDAGIPAVVLEAGEPMRFQPEEVGHGVKAIASLMAHLGMTKKSWSWRAPQPVYYDSFWVRAGQGGILFALVKPGESVVAGQTLGTVTDPITNDHERVLAPRPGRVLGLAVNQMVMPGFALFHVGIERTEAQVLQSADALAPVAPPNSTAAPSSSVEPPSAPPGDDAPAALAPGPEIATPPAPLPPDSAAPRTDDGIPGAGDEAENGGEAETDHADE